MGKLTQHSFVLVQQVSVVEVGDFEHLGLVQKGYGQVMNQHSHLASQESDCCLHLMDMYHSFPQKPVNDYFSSMFLIAVQMKIDTMSNL